MTAVDGNPVTDVVSAEMGLGFAVALKQDETLWAAGYNNNNGQLADGGTVHGDLRHVIYHHVPRLAHIVETCPLGAAGSHVVARKINGSVWGTGHSLYGQVADGTTVSKRLFTAVTTTDGLPMAGAASVNAGNQHTLVVKTDGTAWASGRDNACQLGIGGLGSQLRIVPMLNVDLTPVSGIASLSGGYGHTVAMGTDNSLWAVGSNVSGQLANGTQDGPCNLEPMIQ